MAKGRIKGPSDADLGVFLAKLAAWDGSDPSFQDILVDAAVHAAALRERHKDDIALLPDLERQTNLPQSLLKKWLAGQQLPNKKLAMTVVDEIRVFLSRRRIPPSKRSN